MRLIIADTGPINYLVLIGNIDLLPVLFDKVILPSAVQAELTDPDGRIGVGQASSKRRIVFLSMAPTSCNASMVLWMAAVASLRYFLLIRFSPP